MDNLDIGAFTPEFVEALSQLESLQDLSMNTCKINSLKGFPTSLPLSRLELNENSFPGKDLQYLVGLEVERPPYKGAPDSVSDDEQHRDLRGVGAAEEAAEAGSVGPE